MGNHCQSLLPVAEKWDLGSDLGCVATAQGSRWAGGLGYPLLERHTDPCTPTCSRGKKSGVGVEDEAAVGGFGTKVHLRAEGGGKLLTWVWTAGERHELRVAEQVMQQGAVKRSGCGRSTRAPVHSRHGYGIRASRPSGRGRRNRCLPRIDHLDRAARHGWYCACTPRPGVKRRMT